MLLLSAAPTEMIMICIKKLNLVLGIAFVITLSACSQKSSDDQVKETVAANQQAQDFSEWSSSDSHPDQVFKDWNEKLQKKQITSKEICKTLMNLKDSDLVLFEENIKLKSNATVIKECRIQLLQKIESYWGKEKKELDQSSARRPRVWSAADLANTANFRFPDRVKSVDLSEGYFATTGPTENMEVILTFDDGPHAAYTESILNSLANVNAKAVFFELGQNVRANPSITKKVASAGHSVGAHSMKHFCLPASDRCKKNNGGKRLTSAEGKMDIAGSFKEIFKVLGYVDPYFRFPYGESSTDLKQFLRDSHVGEFYWSVDSNDWRSRGPSGEEWTTSKMLDSVMAQLNGRKRGIILMHDIQRKTEVGLPALLKRLYFGGYTPVLLRQSEVERIHPKIIQNFNGN